MMISSAVATIPSPRRDARERADNEKEQEGQPLEYKNTVLGIPSFATANYASSATSRPANDVRRALCLGAQHQQRASDDIRQDLLIF